MSRRRAAALSTPWHAVVTIWPEGRDGWAVRVATGIDSSTGQEIELDGHVYHPYLAPDFEIVEALSTAPQSVTVTMPWAWEGRSPLDVDLQGATAEVATIYEGDAWEDRRVVVAGEVTSYARGGPLDELTATIGAAAVRGTGDMYPPGAEVSSDRFDDVADAETPAGQSAGLLPPYVVAPVGSSMLAPFLCVVNDTKASAGADYTYRRYLLGMAEPASSGSVHQFVLIHPEFTGRFAAALDSADYRGTPAEGSDDAGGRYWYVDDDWSQGIGSASTAWSSASDEVGPVKIRGHVAVGDYIRRDSDGIADWTEVASVDGTTITLTSTYAGTSASEAGQVIRRPASVGYQGYRSCALGGDLLSDGSGPLSRVVDVLIWALQRSELTVEVGYGDLHALRSRLDHIRLSTVINTRGDGYEWAASQILPWLPIRPYLDGPRLRFAWVGPVDESEIVATIDLDDLGQGWRVGPAEAGSADLVYRPTISYRWMVHDQRHTRTIAQDPTREPRVNPTTGPPWLNTGRALEALAEASGEGLWSGRCNVVEFAQEAGVLMSWLLYALGVRRWTMTALFPADMAWLRVGDIVRVTESDVTRSSQIWRVEAIARSPGAPLRVVLVTVPR